MMDEATRVHVAARAKARCEYCHLPQIDVFVAFHVEHIRAKQHHGSDDLDNLCLACKHCNLRKGPNLGAFDPLTDEVVILFHPRREIWSEHFRFEGPTIVGLSRQGRATVDLLQMNDAVLVALRQEILDQGRILD